MWSSKKKNINVYVSSRLCTLNLCFITTLTLECSVKYEFHFARHMGRYTSTLGFENGVFEKNSMKLQKV